jgi:hypothetical protein
MKRHHLGMAGLSIIASCFADPCVERPSAELDRMPRRTGELLAGEHVTEGSSTRERPCGLAGCTVPPAVSARRPRPGERPLAATEVPPIPEPETAFDPPRPPPITRYLPKRPAPHRSVAKKRPPRVAPADSSDTPAISAAALGIGFAGVGIGAIGMAMNEEAPTTEAWIFSGVLFGLGAAAFATSVVFAVTEDDSVGVALGPGALEIRGSF